MKSNKIFRILAIVAILTLLAVAIPASPVLAAEDIDLDPTSGEIGDKIDINGDGFTASYYTGTYPNIVAYNKYADIYLSPDAASENDDIDDEVETYELVRTVWIDYDGEFDTYFTVPAELNDGYPDEDVTSGKYYVYVTYENTNNIEAVATFTVIAPEILLNPDEAEVDTEIEITGADFEPDENIYVYYDSTEISIESGDDDTDSAGAFEFTILAPESTAGEHTIKVTAGSSVAEAVFTVEPLISINKDKGAPGDNITLQGTGFGLKADVTIEFDGVEIATDETDSDGNFDVVFTVPVKSSATYKIEAEDDDRNKADVNFTVASAITLGQTTGNVGDEVTVSGAGFTPSAQVTITYTSSPVEVAKVTADANGRFTTTFTVPQSTHGAHTITASDGINTTPAVTFTVESTPPPVPQPLLPLDATKAKSKATFEWEGVSDPSAPVTYSLRITDSAGYLVLERTGISETTYTLTNEEKLESTKKEAPYYWTIQAIDGADNQSGWTALQSFYVGFTFELTGWVLYLLIGLGVVILVLAGILVGRRLAYY